MLRTSHTLALVLGAMAPLGCSSSASEPSAAGGSGGTGGTGGIAPAVVEFAVSPGENAHAISSKIYGINGAAAAAEIKAKLVRLGGNPLPAYNWELNATNGGRVEGFVNRASSASSAPGAAVKEVLDAALANGGAAMITVPIGDHVAADVAAGDVHQTGAGYLDTRFKKNLPAKGSALLPVPDLADDSVYQDEFVAWAKGAAGTTPVLFALDNQPELWSEDHSEIHAAQATYEEVVARGTSFAKAIKAAWPGAAVTGYASYGWQGFLSLQNAPGSQGSGEFVSYYLDQMKAAEAANGKRLLDYLDLHWWPEAQGAGVRVIDADTSPDVVAARLQAPRSLWDVTYHEASWINDTLAAASETIHLIPRVKSRIAEHYPGTLLAFSAWYYGGGADISGAIATADVLGIFGREGVDLAAVELSEGEDDSFTLAGFRTFSSYDGAGAHFGDTSIGAASTDPVGTSVYASTESADPGHLVIVALNKRFDAQAATLTISGATSYRSCVVYTLTSSGTAFVAGASLVAAGTNTFSYSMPKLSVSVLVPKP